MNKFSNNNNKRNLKFGMIRANSHKNTKIINDIEYKAFLIDKSIEETKQAKEEILIEYKEKYEPIEIVEEIVQEETTPQPIITMETVYSTNTKADDIVPIEYKDIKPKPKTKLADALRIIMLKKKNGWS